MTFFYESPKRQLSDLLDRIINEEHSFRFNCDRLSFYDKLLQLQHRVIRERLDPADKLHRHRQAHEAMFDSHLKIKREHELIVDKCFTIIRQMGEGLFNEKEMAFEAERLRREYKRMKAEHEVIEGERKKVLRNNDQFIRILNPKE